MDRQQLSNGHWSRDLRLIFDVSGKMKNWKKVLNFSATLLLLLYCYYYISDRKNVELKQLSECSTVSIARKQPIRKHVFVDVDEARDVGIWLQFAGLHDLHECDWRIGIWYVAAFEDGCRSLIFDWAVQFWLEVAVHGKTTPYCNCWVFHFFVIITFWNAFCRKYYNANRHNCEWSILIETLTVECPHC